MNTVKYFKMIALALALTTAFLFTACDSEDKEAKDKKAPAEAAQEKPEPAAPEGLDREPAENEIAAVNGVVITRGDFEKEFSRLQQQLIRSGFMPDPAQFSELKSMAVENLINRELLRQAAEAEGRKADDAEVQKKVDELKAAFAKEEDYKSALERMGFTEEDVAREIRQGILIDAFLQEKFYDKATTDEEQVRKFYDENQDLFVQPEAVHASHILFKMEAEPTDAEKEEAMKRVREVQKKIEAGEDFGALAREFSEGPTAAKDGDLGFFTKGELVPAFEEAAFSMKPGEVSEPVLTQYGYHLIKVIEHRDETVMPLEEAAPKIEEYLRGTEAKKMVEAYIEEQRNTAKVEIFVKDELEPAPVPEAGAPAEDDDAGGGTPAVNESNEDDAAAGGTPAVEESKEDDAASGGAPAVNEDNGDDAAGGGTPAVKEDNGDDAAGAKPADQTTNGETGEENPPTAEPEAGETN